VGCNVNIKELTEQVNEKYTIESEGESVFFLIGYDDIHCTMRQHGYSDIEFSLYGTTLDITDENVKDFYSLNAVEKTLIDMVIAKLADALISRMGGVK